MTFSYWLLAGLVILVAVSALGLRLAGPERVWELFGPADLGNVEFEMLERRKTRNDALACPGSLCGQSDIPPPVFRIGTDELRHAMRRALMGERRLTLVDVQDSPPTDRYVQRSETMHFPDTIIVRYVELDLLRSTVAIYSRSQLGRKDFGVNADRVERWIGKLVQEVRSRDRTTNG
ncbi:MAG: DUF1499 domain-containing protein [Hyphomicrobiales bacterium]|nr:DUF1499 domain-containing protein [Hyphomicrobiales bacterium]